MIKTAETIYIDAPVEQVFDFYKDVENWPTVAPAWLKWSVKDVKRTPELTGTTFAYEAKMAGAINMQGDIEIVEAVPNERIVMRDTGPAGGPQTETFLFDSVNSGMTLTVVDERQGTRLEHLPVVGVLAQRFVNLLTSRWLHVLKRMMEQQRATG
ncbi:MAG TPA: SRPBCC family protein [Acidimicrobiales bacterium]|nr:SRPBCC family protein [Acidimicrobiales bacterium]